MCRWVESILAYYPSVQCPLPSGILKGALVHFLISVLFVCLLASASPSVFQHMFYFTVFSIFSLSTVSLHFFYLISLFIYLFLSVRIKHPIIIILSLSVN